MMKRQLGFGGLQALLAIGVIGVVAVLAVPKYNASMDKAKMTEAFNLAGESKRKLSEFYMVNSRFPKNEAEASALVTGTLSAPEIVQDMVVEPGGGDHGVMIKVFVKPGVIENPGGQEQYIYIAGDEAVNAGYALDWSCGAVGIDVNLLPTECQS